jgi:hypothetical protein
MRMGRAALQCPGRMLLQRRRPCQGFERKESIMSTRTLVIILIIVLVVAGGGYYGQGRWF